MSKGFWIIIGAIVVIFGGILLFRDNNANTPGAANGAQVSNHIEGENQKNITLVEYGDFECSACKAYFSIVEEVVKKYEQDIQFQFRHLPLTTIHKNAFAGSRAAEAAGLQDKFWEMYRLLYENQSAWATSKNAQSYFEQYATQLGINLDQFKTDFASEAVNNTINADIAEFNKTGEKMSTPTFFLNGTKIEPQSADEFSQLIDAEIAKQQPSDQ